MSRQYHSFHGQTDRPEESRRVFRSGAVDSFIAELSKDIRDPDIRKMFERCFPNTLDTTVYFEEKDGKLDSYVVTGDIPAMWLRDSTNQVWPYLELIADDPKLDKMFQGLIRRQVHCVLLDPYANAFNDQHISHQSRGKWWERNKSWHEGVWERKWELDSLGAFLRLSVGYYETTHNLKVFDTEWLQAYDAMMTVLQKEMMTMTKKSTDAMYHFYGPKGEGHPAIRMEGYGYPSKYCGLVRTVFRPSDDESVFPFLIPANAMIVVYLRKSAALLKELNMHHMSFASLDLANTIEEGIMKYGVVEHEKYGKIYAYEVDGFGSHYLMDDPNVPSLLSLPYLDFCPIQDEVYQSTREFILSRDNPYYAKGVVAEGLTSPHTGVLSHFWPMSTIMQGLTTHDEEEMFTCLCMLKKTDAETYFMHESVNVDDPKDYTRSWFSWANSLFGELIVRIHREAPNVLKEIL